MLEKADYLQIRKRAPHCAHCGKPFTGDERHPSLLMEQNTFCHIGQTPPLPGGAPGSPVPAPPAPPDNKESTPETQETPFQRFDLCADCWAAFKDQAYFSYWMGRPNTSNLPPKKLNRVERNLALLALFDSLAERNGEENDYTPHLFFLAHLLMRYKIFKWLPALRDPANGRKTLLFSRSDSEEPVQVSDMDLPDEMIASIKDEIEQYLERSTGQAVPL